MEKVYAVIDLKSFYASVECAKRGLDPFTTPLVVCDETRGPGSLIMAVTPYLKSKGLSNIMRRFDLPKEIPIIYAKPHMEEYVNISTEFNAFLLTYFAKEDWYPYSIDETFINLTPYLNLYQKTPEQLVEHLIKEILKHFSLYVTVGIAPNMFLAKCALDLEAKKDPRFYARWTKEDVQTKLWKVKPLNKIWGIGNGYMRRLNKLELYTLEDVAKYPKSKIKEHFGIMGEQLWEHAHGIDDTNLSEPYTPSEKSLTSGQVLHRDYNNEEALILIREMSDELCFRLRRFNLKAQLVSLGVGTTRGDDKHYNKQMSLLLPTNINKELFNAYKEIFMRFAVDAPIRTLHLSVGKLTSNPHDQISLVEEFIKNDTREKKLWEAIDDLHARFGKDKVMRANALTRDSTYLRRAKQIGGHRK